MKEDKAKVKRHISLYNIEEIIRFYYCYYYYFCTFFLWRYLTCFLYSSADCFERTVIGRTISERTTRVRDAFNSLEEKVERLMVYQEVALMV